MKKQGTFQRLTTSYRPQDNGQVENLNKELCSKLKMFCSDQSRQHDWDRTVFECAYAYNTSVHVAHGYTPFYLLTGYDPPSLLNMYWLSTQPPFPASGNAADVSHFQRHHWECYDLAHRKLTAAAEKIAQGTTTPVEKQPFFKVGDHGRVCTEHLPMGTFDNKLSSRVLGPFKVVGQLSLTVYEVDVGGKYPGVHKRVNVDRLRPYHQRSSAPHLRTTEDYPPVGISRETFEALLDRRRARGRPKQKGRPHLQYLVQFPGVDHHYDVWWTETQLRNRYPTQAPVMIHAYQKYPLEA
jgi:hypothetical protein